MWNIVIIVNFIILISTFSFAEDWICFDKNTNEIQKVYQGDCLKAGICTDYNNQGILENCFEATENEFKKAYQIYIKYDPTGLKDQRIIDMTIDEITAKQKPQKDEEERIQNLIISTTTNLKTLGFTDEEINFILNHS